MAARSSPPAGKQRVTALLDEVRQGHEAAFDELFEEVYTELRRRARGQRRRWRGDPSLDTTALAHEAYLKLVDQESRSWANRSHFFAVAATAMRHLLINRAERQRAQKRGGKSPVRSLEKLREALGREVAPAEQRNEALVVLEEALELFEEEWPRAARVVEYRFFGGMTIEQTAEAIGISPATVSRDWKLARGWLYREMKRIVAGRRPQRDA